MLVVNPDDKDIWNRQFNVVLNAYAETLQVYANSAQGALDEAMDYAWDQGWVGYFLDDDAVAELEAEGFLEEYASGGNASRYLSSHNLSIVDVTGDDWD